jgi:hypothetical protein
MYGRALLASLVTILWFSGLAAQPVAAESPGANAMVRIGWFSSAENVDVYLDGARTLPNLAFKAMSDYEKVPAGTHRIEIRPAGADPASAAQATVDAILAAGSQYTVAGAGGAPPFTTAVFNDDFTSPGPDHAMVRAIHMAPDVPPVDIALHNGPTVVQNLSFTRATAFLPVPPGMLDLELRETSDTSVLLQSAEVRADPGSVMTLIGVGGVGMPVEVLALPEAAATTVQGGSRTGEGGLALPAELAALGALLILTMLGLSVWQVRAAHR